MSVCVINNIVTPRGRDYRSVWVTRFSVTPRGRSTGVYGLSVTKRPRLVRQECMGYLSHPEADTTGVSIMIIGWKSHRLNAAPEPHIMNDDQTKTNIIVYMAI